MRMPTRFRLALVAGFFALLPSLAFAFTEVPATQALELLRCSKSAL